MTSVPSAPMPQPRMVASQWRSTTGLRTALTWLFAADAAAAVAMAVTHLHRAGVIDDYQHGSATVPSLNGADGAVQGAAAATLIGLVATAMVLIVWQFRSAKNNEVLGRIRPRFTPGWSIGGWFIPFANLVIPVRIFQDLWQGSDPANRNFRDWRGLRRSSVIGWWWAFWITGYGLGRTVTGTDTTTLAEIRTLDRIDAFGVILTAVAAGLAIVVVRTITSRQETARAERRSDTAAGPGWYPDPNARFDHRYWDGAAWTDYVSTAGQMVTDPVAEIGGNA